MNGTDAGPADGRIQGSPIGTQRKVADLTRKANVLGPSAFAQDLSEQAACVAGRVGVYPGRRRRTHPDPKSDGTGRHDRARRRPGKPSVPGSRGCRRRGFEQLGSPRFAPGIEFMADGVDRSAFLVQVPMHRQLFGSLPPLHGPDIALEIGGDFLPRFEAVGRLHSGSTRVYTSAAGLRSGREPTPGSATRALMRSCS